MAEERSKSYIEVFQDAAAECFHQKNIDSLFHLLSLFFDGVEHDCSLPCLAEMKEEHARLSYKKGPDESLYISVLTNMNGEKHPLIADVNLKTLVRIVMNDKGCGGIRIGTDDEQTLYIPKYFLAYAISAGYQMAMEDR